MSYFAIPNPSSSVMIAQTVPPEGFVLTDFYVDNAFSGRVRIYERVGEQNSYKLSVNFNDDVHRLETHLRSGVPFAPGSSIFVQPDADLGGVGVTIAGYPTNSVATGGVPAVSTWGLAIMGLLVLTAGTVAILRRRDQNRDSHGAVS